MASPTHLLLALEDYYAKTRKPKKPKKPISIAEVSKRQGAKAKGGKKGKKSTAKKKEQLELLRQTFPLLGKAKKRKAKKNGYVADKIRAHTARRNGVEQSDFGATCTWCLRPATRMFDHETPGMQKSPVCDQHITDVTWYCYKCEAGVPFDEECPFCGKHASVGLLGARSPAKQ